MKLHQIALILVILVIGYVIGAKYPSLLAKVGV
jgi:hypothetical protein